MIVAETEAGYRFVTQPDHAALAGQFADRWGNDAFERPEPRFVAVLAAYRHDDGWIEYDRRPHLGDEGAPVDFRETPPGAWIPIYDRGVDAVVGVDPYAGLLVSMHGTGLRRRRYGLSPSWPDTPPAYADFVERHEERQAEIARDLREGNGDGPVDEPAGRISETDLAALASLHATGAPPEGADSGLWRNYRLLQAWDTLSLAFCTTDSPPGYPRIESVPTAPSEPDATLTIDALGDGAFRVRPYPFDADPLVVSVPTRTVARDAFDDEEGATRAYYGGAREIEAFTLQG